MANTDSAREPYILQRSYRSSNRLNFNHWLIKECCNGWLLHPKIKKPQAEARIADVATGTALWLLETASSLPPTIQHDGFDISSAQFPPKAWTPANVTLHEQDFFQPWPKQYHGQYDIVHAQLLVCMINDENARIVLKNMVDLLKPNGQIQWLESDVANQRVHSSAPPGTPTPYNDILNAMMAKPRPNSTYNWLSQMPQIFQDCGLMLEASEQIPMKHHLRLMAGQSILAGIEDTTPEMRQGGKLVGAKIDELVPGLIDEFSRGIVLDRPWQVFVGRKAEV